MRKYSADKMIHQDVKELLKEGWEITRTKKHKFLTAPNGKKILISGTPSDYRARLNFRRDCRNIMKENPD